MSLITLLATLLVSWAASADDSPYHDPELCVRGGQTVTVEGRQYARININAHLEQSDPRKCSLRSAYPMYPIYESGKPLGQQEWLRSVYAANQGPHPTVLRRCVPNSSPAPSATAEELAECPHSFINYMDVPSNGWIAWILIPRQPVATWAEKQTAAAKTSCSEATSEQARRACQEAGYGQSEKPQSPIVVIAPAFESQLNAALDKLSRKFSEGSLRVAVSQSKMAADYYRIVGNRWFVLSLLIAIAFLVEGALTSLKIRSLKRELREARHQKTMPTGATLQLQNNRLQEELKKANQTIKQLQSVDHKLDKELLEQQHNAELLEANRGWQEKFDEAAAVYNRRLEVVSNEITERNSDIAERDNVIVAKDKTIASQEGQIAACQFKLNEVRYNSDSTIGLLTDELKKVQDKLVLFESGQAMNKTALETKHSAALAERDAVIADLRYEILQLKDQLRAANDNAATPQAPSTVTTPPSTATSPTSDLSPDAKLEAAANLDRAVHDLIRTVQDSSTDLEKIALDAGFKAIKLEADLELACYCKQMVESDLAAKDGELSAAVIQLAKVRLQHAQLQLLYTLSQAALQKAVGSDCAGEETIPLSEGGGVLLRAIDQGLGSPKLPVDLNDQIPDGVVPPGKASSEDPDITVEGAHSGPEPEPYTAPDHSQVVGRPEPPHTPTIPIVAPPADKKQSG